MRNHRFDLVELLDEDDIPREYAHCRAVCARCGEERKVYWAVSKDVLNIGPCKKRRWWHRRDGWHRDTETSTVWKIGP